LIVEIADTEPDAATARTRIDARKWVASKLLPKVYGDQVNVTGAVTGNADTATKLATGKLARTTSASTR
jgi:hypothetical protein